MITNTICKHCKNPVYMMKALTKNKHNNYYWFICPNCDKNKAMNADDIIWITNRKIETDMDFWNQIAVKAAEIRDLMGQNFSKDTIKVLENNLLKRLR